MAFYPYRISPLGAHIDHKFGKINGLAIDKGIHMAYRPKQNSVPEYKEREWADHLRGATKRLWKTSMLA